MIEKIEVTKSVYDDVRFIEDYTGMKIATESNAVYNAGFLNYSWGVYQVMHCYKSFSKYYAKVKLIEVAASENEADKRRQFYEDENDKKYLNRRS